MHTQKKAQEFCAFPNWNTFIALLACLGFSGTAFSQQEIPEEQNVLREVRELRSLVTELQRTLERQNEVIRQLQREHQDPNEEEVPITGHEDHAHDPEPKSEHGHADLESDGGFSDNL